MIVRIDIEPIKIAPLMYKDCNMDHLFFRIPYLIKVIKILIKVVIHRKNTFFLTILPKTILNCIIMIKIK